MKKKNRNWIYSLLIIGVCLLLTEGCLKDEDTPAVLSPITFSPDVTYETVTDIDGNVYKTVTIGTQTWMAENLRTTKYRNGEAIPNVKDATEWKNLKTAAFCDYGNTGSKDSIAVFGLLYNWYAASDSRNIAPEGWHIPSDAEWSTLTTLLVDSLAGGKLKEADIIHWTNATGINAGATNETGFTALPGSGCSLDGVFKNIGYHGYWWSASSENVDGFAWFRYIDYDYSGLSRASSNEFLAFSVRCVKD